MGNASMSTPQLVNETESGRRVGPEESYAKVPGEILMHPNLGPAAVRIWGYAWWRLGIETWILRKADICSRCKIGEHAWNKAIAELTAAGLYRLDRHRFKAGTLNSKGKKIGGREGVEHVFFWPGYQDRDQDSSTAPQKLGGRSKIAAAQVISGGRPAAERRAGGLREKKPNTKKEREASRARDPDPAASAASRPIKRPSGIWCVEPSDPAAAEKIEADCTQDEVGAAVNDVRYQLTSKGKARWPTPGPVWDSILRTRKALAAQRKSCEQAAEARQRDANRARRASDPDARRAGEAAMTKAAAELAKLGIRMPSSGG
jgi:hypothetical protein